VQVIKFNSLGFDIGNKTSGQVKIVCPYCSEQRKNKHDKSLSINIDSGQFKCHHCEKTGNIHEFRIDTQPKKEYTRPPTQSELDISQKAVEWFKSRSISLNTLKKAKITTGKEWMPQTEKETSVIKFNYFRNDELINIKYRDAYKNFKMFKDAELIFYNLDLVKESENLIITEGEIDALSFIESGLNYVVSVPNGANTGSMSYIDNCFEYTTDKNKIYLAVDNDTAGIKLRTELLRRFGFERCLKVDFKDCKDANEYLIKYGPDELKQTIDQAKPFPVEGIITLNDYYAEFVELKNNGIHRGLTLGTNLDFIIRWETGRLCTITGIPSHGKGVFVDFITCKFATKHDFKVCFFSPENFPVTLHFKSLAEMLTGKKLEEFNDQEFENVCHFINNNFSFIKPDDSNYSLETILEKLRHEVFLHGTKVVVIDPWNRLEHQIPKGVSETNYISESLTKLSMFAQNNDVLVILVAHPTKMRKIKDTMLYEEPTLYDISGSAHFYNKTDYGLTVYRDYTTMNTRVSVNKVKFRNLGEQGRVETKFNMNNARLTDFDNESVFWDNTNWLIPKKEYRLPEEQLTINDQEERSKIPPY
jgi:twinkle protein